MTSEVQNECRVTPRTAGLYPRADERTTCPALWEVVGALGSFPGVQLARRTLERFDPRMVGSRSDLERTLFRGLREHGVDLPQANVAIVDADGRRRYLDFAYVPERRPRGAAGARPRPRIDVGRS